MIFKGALLASLASVSFAQNASMSLCDKYTTALTGNNTGVNQYTVLTLLVNTAVIGNYSALANKSIGVPGILNPNGTYMGQKVNLVPYFDGTLASTNNGSSVGVKKNFLDGGGAAPLMQNKPANDMTSNQYFLLTHLYEFFGLLLGCSEVGMTGFPAYGGSPSMYEVHKFMVLSPSQMNYFITQVALAGMSFGVAPADLTAIGTALNNAFNYRCEAPLTIVPSAGNVTQSICTDPTCPIAPGGTCANVANITAPAGAMSVSPSGAAGSSTAKGSGASTATGSAAGSSSSAKSSANTIVASLSAAAVGLVGAVAVVLA